MFTIFFFNLIDFAKVIFFKQLVRGAINFILKNSLFETIFGIIFDGVYLYPLNYKIMPYTIIQPSQQVINKQPNVLKVLLLLLLLFVVMSMFIFAVSTCNVSSFMQISANIKHLFVI